METHPFTRKIFSRLPKSFSNSLLLTFFSPANTIPALCLEAGYFLSLSALASSSFFTAAADRAGTAGVTTGVEPEGASASTDMASLTMGALTKGVPEGPEARIPTTVPAWPRSSDSQHNTRVGVLYCS